MKLADKPVVRNKVSTLLSDAQSRDCSCLAYLSRVEEHRTSGHKELYVKYPEFVADVDESVASILDHAEDSETIRKVYKGTVIPQACSNSPPEPMPQLVKRKIQEHADRLVPQNHPKRPDLESDLSYLARNISLCASRDRMHEIGDLEGIAAIEQACRDSEYKNPIGLMPEAAAKKYNSPEAIIAASERKRSDEQMKKDFPHKHHHKEHHHKDHQHKDNHHHSAHTGSR